MNRQLTSVMLTALFLGVSAVAQTPPPAVLQIELENYVVYFSDVADYSKLATDPNKTTAVVPKNYGVSYGIADIVSVNGKAVKGVFTERRFQLNHTPTPAPGQAIADAVRQNFLERHYEILKADGTQIGSIMTVGPGGGSPPPGAPLAIVGANFVVVGGTGAFLGARGQGGGTQDPRPDARNASVTEDPANRRLLGGGLRRFVIQVIPFERPEILQTANGPAVVHASDFSLVTAAKPAHPGEILSLIATGLGPTDAKLEPGTPFPASPLANVNSPVEVTVNGQAAEVLYAGGYPQTTNVYQVNVRLPGTLVSGAATLQLAAAWIAGTPISIPVQQ